MCSNFDFDEVTIDILLLLMRTSFTIKEEFHRNESNQLRIVYFPFIACRRGLTSDDLAVCASLRHFIVRDECTLARAYGLAASVVKKKRNVNGRFLYIFFYLSVLKTCQFWRLNCRMPRCNENKEWREPLLVSLSHHSIPCIWRKVLILPPPCVRQRLPLPLIINLPCSRKAKALDMSPFFMVNKGTMFC